MFVNDQVILRLGISYTPVREAARRLEMEVSLRYQPRKGVKVRPINLNEFEKLIALRKTLEPVVLERSISVRDLFVAELADARLQKWNGASGSSEMLDSQWEFFRTMYEASRLVLTMEVIETNWCFIERFHRHSWENSDEAKRIDFEYIQRIIDLFSKKRR